MVRPLRKPTSAPSRADGACWPHWSASSRRPSSACWRGSQCWFWIHWRRCFFWLLGSLVPPLTLSLFPPAPHLIWAGLNGFCSRRWLSRSASTSAQRCGSRVAIRSSMAVCYIIGVSSILRAGVIRHRRILRSYSSLSLRSSALRCCLGWRAGGKECEGERLCRESACLIVRRTKRELSQSPHVMFWSVPST